MKRFFTIVSAVVALTACDKVVTPDASIEPRTAVVDYDGGTSVFALTCNTTWTATCDYEEVTVTPSSGEGDATITVTVPPSTYEDTRSIRVTVVAANDESTTTHTARHIITLAAKPFIRLASNEGYVSPDGGGVRIDVYSNRAWSVSSDRPDLVTVSPASGLNNGSVAVSVPENATGSARTSRITVSLVDFPGAAVDYTLIQNSK